MIAKNNTPISYANRGKPFEELINFANEQYRARKTAVIKQNPTKWIPIRGFGGKIVSAKVEEKAVVDFDGVYGMHYIAFDAKHTEKDRISLKAVELHQAEFLDDCMQHENSFCFILVSFSMNRFFLVPWREWSLRIQARKQKRAMASIHIDELLPEWEVKQVNGIVLDYLSVVDRIVKIGG